MITVYSKPNCPQCVTAKTLLTSHHMVYSEVEVDYGQITTKDTISRTDFIEKFPSVRSLPHITENEVSIGSLANLVDWLKK